MNFEGGGIYASPEMLGFKWGGREGGRERATVLWLVGTLSAESSELSLSRLLSGARQCGDACCVC